MTTERTAPHGRAAFEASLPALGRRGEGWIAIQMVLEIGALVAAVRTGPVLDGTARVAAGVAGIALMVAGVLLFAWGASHLGSTFSVWVEPRPTGSLVTTGPYRWARHPVCTAQVLIVAGWALASASVVTLVMAAVVAAYLDRFKLAREEQTLLVRYPDYAAYAATVRHRMLLGRPARVGERRGTA